MLRLPSLSARLLKKVLRRYRSLFGRRFWGLNFGRRTRPYKMASTVPCLHGAVELLLTGGQHKPCACFIQQACRTYNIRGKEDWDKEGHINHPKRSETALTTDDIHQLQQDTRAHNELRAPMNQFMERQFANQEPLRKQSILWRYFGTWLEARNAEAPKSEPGKVAACRHVSR